MNSRPTPPKPAAQILEGWGRYPRVEAPALESENLPAITDGATLCRGLGRAYGDAALPGSSDGVVAITPLADRVLCFNTETGRFRAEAGLSLHTLNRITMPHGWFTPVTTGTQFVTLGGMVASDVHGKNHHVAGTFGRHVSALRMRVADGRILEVTRESEPELFVATLGGMGLTGHILEVEFQLEAISSPWIYEESERLPDIEQVLERLGTTSKEWPMTVAWIDTSSKGKKLGRGIVMAGRWATKEEAAGKPAMPPEKFEIAVPFTMPHGLVSNFTLGLANTAWYTKHGSKHVKHIAHPQGYFYPLDAISKWNKGYGPKGFTQYQCVMPTDAKLFREFLELFQKMGGASFVTVFKDCGPAGEGLMSFPKRGTSIALDIPVRAKTQALVDALNEYVLKHDGRIYLAKDAFTRREHFQAMYPNLKQFNAIRRTWDPEGRLSSAMARRLIDEEVS
ncbi:MAG: FAD-binding protein [Bradymonadia bacterium]